MGVSWKVNFTELMTSWHDFLLPPLSFEELRERDQHICKHSVRCVWYSAAPNHIRAENQPVILNYDFFFFFLNPSLLHVVSSLGEKTGGGYH